MGMDTQAKVLRVLQDKRFMHLGGVHEIQVDVRIIARHQRRPCSRPCARAASAKTSTTALNVIQLELPPPAQPPRGHSLLVAHFLKFYAEENGMPARTLAPKTLRMLMDYEWPGNVRELENVIERGVVLSTTDEIGPELLPAAVSGNPYSAGLIEHKPDTSLFDIMEELERRNHHRPAGTLQLEPDRRGRVLQTAALHAQPEGETAEHRDPQSVTRK